MDDRSRGLYAKYSVERNDGRPLGQCFVLEVNDPNTWTALHVWADAVEDDGYHWLADDIRRQVWTHEKIPTIAVHRHFHLTYKTLLLMCVIFIVFNFTAGYFADNIRSWL